ncbi:MAG: arsenate reductase ArsC [Candidatus Acidulodesulfobacterium ferriphilum]|uniref:Arsenate reductase ArsC n=1 Tax=Candidatus Acidulodesulfobacterium ferriphilum TaxID=2597223 RepID=A0A519BDK5_9DELT|nr:MAG: arsenate reductase ArsC [Candidatus Acidulodesulfobacterium ferriphilum]
MKIIFLCAGNSARSQMAEGFTRDLKEKIYKDKNLIILSAGVSPKPVNPLTVKVMAEKGIDLTEYKSKSLDDIDLTNADYIITLCGDAKDNCPYVGAKTKNLHWDLLDPANVEGSEEEKLDFFRKIRDEIEIRVKDFLKTII